MLCVRMCSCPYIYVYDSIYIHRYMYMLSISPYYNEIDTVNEIEYSKSLQLLLL